MMNAACTLFDQQNFIPLNVYHTKCESQELQFWHLLCQRLENLLFIVSLSTIHLGCEKTSQFHLFTKYQACIKILLYLLNSSSNNTF